MHLDALPIWLLFVITMAIVMVSIEIGHRLGRARRRQSEEEKESPVGAIAGAILGLSAFMLAFTFGIASSRYDARKELVREDAVAIRTAWSRADFLPDADRAEAKRMLRDYVDQRVNLAVHYAEESDHVGEFLAQAQQIQDRLWNMAVANARQDMNSDVAAMYIDALNDMNAVHAQRVSVAIQGRIPAEIRTALIVLTVLGMMAVGYQSGIAGSRRSVAGPILAIAFAMVIVLIALLDRPERGVIYVTQQPLLDVQTMMRSQTSS